MRRSLTHAAMSLCALAAGMLLHGLAGAAQPPAGASEVAALPGGHWLSVDKRGLALVDASGTERARWPGRGKHLDTRPGAGNGEATLGVLLDADTQRTLRVVVDADGTRLQVQPVIESPAFAVEALCLYRDEQGLDQVFLIGSEGLAEHWVLHGGGAMLLRRLAVPPDTQACRADDAAGLLYVNEEGGGVWAYRAQAEGAPARHAVALPRPLGRLEGDATALAVLPGGVAVSDRAGVHLLRRDAAGAWQGHRLKNAGPQDALHVLPPAPGAARQQLHLLGRHGKTKSWRTHSLPWAAPTATMAAPPYVRARVQTEPMARYGDAADDPAIWVHAGDATRSRVLATNKKQGLLVYDLQGRQQQLLQTGRLNNVDLRQRVRLGEQTLDIAVATQRDEGSLVLFLIDDQGQVQEHTRVPTGLQDIYGVCLYQPRAGGLQVFVNDKDGSVLRYRLEPGPQHMTATLMQRFKLASQPEACVADDAQARLFIGEEKRGVWVMPLETDPRAAALQLAVPLGPLLKADVEGLALHHGPAGSYLVVSSQGSNSYLVADAAPPYRVRGAFRIGMDLERGIDGVSETDGLEVSAAALGPVFPHGMLVVQDGVKRLPDGAQNFKLVGWEDVARALGLP